VLRAIYGIVAREFLRFRRQRGRLLSSIARPLVWLLFAGSGLAAIFAGAAALDYRRYMVPGLLGMTVLFGAFMAALSTVYDRDAGVLRILLIAPVHRRTVALGKTLAAGGLGTAQALALALLLVPALDLWPGPARALLTVAAIALTSLAIGGLGLVLAACVRSIENFAGVMNFVVFPLFFLSGALYPAREIAAPLRVLVHANPLAYGVDLMKHGLLTPWTPAGYGGEFAPALDVMALVAFAIASLALATPLLGREEGVTRAAFRTDRT
jgi:ABC-2 type transport system permease protein